MKTPTLPKQTKDRAVFQTTPPLRRAPSLEHASDEALMVGLARRQPGALRQLVRRYASVLHGVIYSVIHNEAETQEVVNDVFLHSWKNASHYSPDKGKPLGWLVTMARRRGIDRLRKRERYHRATGRLETEIRHDPSAWVSTHDASRDAQADDLRQIVRRKVDALPPFQRQAIRFAFYKGMSQREIASATGIPLGTIKTRIELGLQKLSVSMRGLRRELPEI